MTKLITLFDLFGIQLRLLYRALRSVPRFVGTARAYCNIGSKQFPFRITTLFPVLTDFRSSAGAVDGHYFHQDLWFARKIFETRPSAHVDVGSRLDGFVAHLLTFMPVTVLDVRGLDSGVSGLKFIREDATQLGRFANGSIESLSSLHAVEHFGLGRYGDPIDPNGCFRAMQALARVLRMGGRLYFSVPIGQERLEFNAHRIFAPQTVLETFGNAGLTLLSFAAIDDEGRLVTDRPPAAFSSCRYACGLFEFSKVGHEGVGSVCLK